MAEAGFQPDSFQSDAFQMDVEGVPGTITITNAAASCALSNQQTGGSITISDGPVS
jgi:hypothetical protein